VKRSVLLFTVSAVMAAMMALAGPAFADHAHYLVTPGTTVEDIGGGQTKKCSTDPGGHKFHKNMHAGQPGEEDGAFDNPRNPVSVGKSENATC
jgi:hypothetical protein